MAIVEFIEKTEQEYDIQPGTLKPDSKFKEEINWSSINAVVFSTMIEFEYNVIVTSQEFKEINTIAELFELINQKKQVNGGA